MIIETEFICKCSKCNRITVKFINGAWNTMTKTTFITNIGALPEDITVTYQCNGCINNWTVENKQYKLFEIKQFVSWVK